VRILVEDTGVGIAPASVDRLFTPFDRLGAEHGGIEGTGLGLALSQKLAEAMGGTIGVRSRVGAGSTFWVELAAGAMQQLHPAPGLDTDAPHEAAEGATPERTVLYIEDSLPNFRLVERIFARMRGVHLISAMQGRLGLELAQRHRPDLILLDINLPDIPGTEVLSRLREDPELRETPVVVISANAMTDQVRAVETRGVHAYLTKPFDVSAFVELTERLLDRVGDMP
jgi:CheY-like chemotaxis protein